MRRCLRPHALLIAAAGLFLGLFLAASPTIASETNEARIQGAWSVFSVEMDGKPVRNLPVLKDWIFSGEQLQRGEDRCAFKLGANHGSNHIDFMRADEPSELAIYRLDGDDLRVEFHKIRTQRPGLIPSGGTVFHLKRVKRPLR